MGERAILQIARLLAKGVPIHKINKIAGTCILARPDRLPSDLQRFIEKESTFAFASLGQDKKRLLQRPFPESDAYILLPGYQEVSQDKWLYATAFRLQYHEQAPVDGKTLVQRHSDRYLIQNPPQPPCRPRNWTRCSPCRLPARSTPRMWPREGCRRSKEVSLFDQQPSRLLRGLPLLRHHLPSWPDCYPAQ